MIHATPWHEISSGYVQEEYLLPFDSYFCHSPIIYIIIELFVGVCSVLLEQLLKYLRTEDKKLVFYYDSLTYFDGEFSEWVVLT